MTRPDDIPEDAWDVANAVMQLYFHGTNARNQDQWDAYVLIAASAILADRAQRSALAQPSAPEGFTDAQIKHMVARFLTWRLPDDFAPDGGISFEKISNPGTTFEYRHEPVGTNLLTATQAEAMVRHMLAARPLPPAPTAEEV